MIGYCLAVEAIALAATLVAAFVVPIAPNDLAMFALLAGFGLGQAELGRTIERVRRQISNSPQSPHINVTSVWTFAGVLILPPQLVAVLVAALYAQLWLRCWRGSAKTRPFRTVFNASLIILTCFSVMLFLAVVGVHGIGGVLDRGWVGASLVAAAALGYFVVNLLVAIPGLNPATKTFLELIGGWADNLLEIATICLGVLTALAMITRPVLALAVIPPLLLLHRTVLAKQLAAAAARDGKTGVFNLEGWHNLASGILRRTNSQDGASVAVLSIDLDRFRRINYAYGYEVGDAVIKAVADTISAQVRSFDPVGRLGAEDFAVLLSGITKDNAIRVAEQVRLAIERLTVSTMLDGRRVEVAGLSASIGVAMAPKRGAAVNKLIEIADTARCVAKVTGSNKVVALPEAN